LEQLVLLAAFFPLRNRLHGLESAAEIIPSTGRNLRGAPESADRVASSRKDAEGCVRAPLTVRQGAQNTD
jgi:hypothetical protein